MPDDGFGQKRDVADSVYATLIDGKTFGTAEVAVDERQIKLKSKAIVEPITNDELRDRTVEALPGGIIHFPVIELERAKMGEW